MGRAHRCCHPAQRSTGPTQFSSTPRPGYGANSRMDTPEGGAFIPNIPSSPSFWTPKVPKWTDEQEQEGRDYVRRMGGRLIMTDEDGTILPEGTPFWGHYNRKKGLGLLWGLQRNGNFHSLIHELHGDAKLYYTLIWPLQSRLWYFQLNMFGRATCNEHVLLLINMRIKTSI